MFVPLAVTTIIFILVVLLPALFTSDQLKSQLQNDVLEVGKFVVMFLIVGGLFTFSLYYLMQGSVE
ncbi:MAG: hypothetical protein ACK40G_08745 [Cytophagaceae bacterium]